jgi:hypothetical protein
MDNDVKGCTSSRQAMLAPRPVRLCLPQLRGSKVNPFLDSKVSRKSPERNEAHEEMWRILSLPPIHRSSCNRKEVAKKSPSPPWVPRASLNPIVQDKAFKALDEVSDASTSASRTSLC